MFLPLALVGREGLLGMIGVDQIGQIRRAYFEQRRPSRRSCGRWMCRARRCVKSFAVRRPSSSTRAAGSAEEARRFAQRRALQGLGPAARLGPGPRQAEEPRGWRSSVRQSAGRGARPWVGRGRGRLRRSDRGRHNVVATWPTNNQLDKFFSKNNKTFLKLSKYLTVFPNH